MPHLVWNQISNETLGEEEISKAKKAIRNYDIAPNYLEISYSDYKGRGIIAKKDIKGGEFLTFYAGKFCSTATENEQYLFQIRDGNNLWFVDATKEDGSYGRLLNDNHQNPNVSVKAIKNDFGIPVPTFFARTFIEKGGECEFNYNGESSNYWWRKRRLEDAQNSPLKIPRKRMKKLVDPPLSSEENFDPGDNSRGEHLGAVGSATFSASVITKNHATCNADMAISTESQKSPDEKLKSCHSHFGICGVTEELSRLTKTMKHMLKRQRQLECCVFTKEKTIQKRLNRISKSIPYTLHHAIKKNNAKLMTTIEQMFKRQEEFQQKQTQDFLKSVNDIRNERIQMPMCSLDWRNFSSQFCCKGMSSTSEESSDPGHNSVAENLPVAESASFPPSPTGNHSLWEPKILMESPDSPDPSPTSEQIFDSHHNSIAENLDGTEHARFTEFVSPEDCVKCEPDNLIESSNSFAATSEDVHSQNSVATYPSIGGSNETDRTPSTASRAQEAMDEREDSNYCAISAALKLASCSADISKAKTDFEFDLPNFSRYVQPYLNGASLDPKTQLAMRNEIIEELISYLDASYLLLGKSRIRQSWGYRRLGNSLVKAYPLIIRETKESRPRKGELGYLMTILADRRRKRRVDK